MQIPQGYNHEPPSRSYAPLVCKQNKSIYGLKQASRSWFNMFKTTLTSQNYTQSKYDYTLFTKGTGSSFIAILVYVDDIVIASPNKITINSAKIMLQHYFKLKDLGDIKFFLGLELSRSQVGIFMCHRHYTMSILEDTGMLACKPSAVPMEADLKLNAKSGSQLPDPRIYRRLIGRLLYLTISRHDICYTVHKLSQFVSDPRSGHWMQQTFY